MQVNPDGAPGGLSPVKLVSTVALLSVDTPVLKTRYFSMSGLYSHAISLSSGFKTRDLHETINDFDDDDIDVPDLLLHISFTHRRRPCSVIDPPIV